MLKIIQKRPLLASVYRGFRRLLRSRPTSPGSVQAASFYDRTFEQNPAAQGHYTRSAYYMIWTVIIDRLRREAPSRILEIGCGAGQLAHALHDAGVVGDYCGFDFSSARVAHARRINPGLRFEIADAFSTDLYTQFSYDAVVCTEFLEHVENDLDVLQRLPAGVRVIATVPNFPYVSHVRHFTDAAAVSTRYGPLFDDFHVASLRANEHHKTFFLLEGIKH